MAHLVLVDAYLSLNGVDLSDHVKRVVITYSADIVDNTTMSKVGHVRLGGLKDWSLSVDFAQDYAASEVDATLFPLVGTAFAIEVRPTSAARSATNPGYQGTGILENYQPVSGAVGDEAQTSVSISCSNGVALIRAVA